MSRVDNRNAAYRTEKDHPHSRGKEQLELTTAAAEAGIFPGRGRFFVFIGLLGRRAGLRGRSPGAWSVHQCREPRHGQATDPY